MARPTYIPRTDEYKTLVYKANEHKEDNDCAVKSVAIVCGVEYEVAHKVLKDLGRINREGVRLDMINTACEHLGKQVLLRCPYEDFISKYPGVHSKLQHCTSHHPFRFPKVWSDGKKYLMFTRNHVLAIINGKAHDWSASSALRAFAIYEVKEA